MRMRMRTREGLSVFSGILCPCLKGVAGGLGNKGVRANSPIRILLGRQQRTRFDFRPGGLGENRSVEFPRSSAYADGGKGGRKRPERRGTQGAC